MSKPRWSDEEWVLEMPDAEKIPCKDCFFRKEDTAVAKGCTYGICKVYPNGKPTEVFLKHEKCPYYLDENEKDEE